MISCILVVKTRKNSNSINIHSILRYNRNHDLINLTFNCAEKKIFSYLLCFILPFQFFQVRAHMYQARSLIGSDASGLSDPFARVIIGEWCKITQVSRKTVFERWICLNLTTTKSNSNKKKTNVFFYLLKSNGNKKKRYQLAKI